MKELLFKGLGVALVTPFNENGVDYDALEKLLEFQISHNADALIICGTTGEASAMSEDEHKSVLKFCVDKVASRIPIIAGTGCNNIDRAIRMSRYAYQIGCNGLLVVTPYYNKATQKGLKKYYGMIAESVDIPIIVYNVPSRTGVSISLETLKFLDENYNNIAAIKEASGDLTFATRILAETELAVYSGNDDVTLPILAVGGSGVISVVANILPEEMHNICKNYDEGNCDEARRTFVKLIRLMDAMFYEVNPIPIKTAMNLMGFNAGKLRAPLCSMEDENFERLKKVLLEYDLI